jgi:ribosomal protein S18 acetylase RimI-like enzyme
MPMLSVAMPGTWTVLSRGKTMTAATSQLAGFTLKPFKARWAATVAGWVTDVTELRLLAPGTPWPLNAGKVTGWLKPGGRAMMLVSGSVESSNTAAYSAVGEAVSEPFGTPIGYGELNPMSGHSEQLWLGHVILRPDWRGRGWGELLVRSLVGTAWHMGRVRKIALVVFPENTAAIECYLRAGFRSIREEQHQFTPDQSPIRLLRMEMSRERWSGPP